MNECSNELLSRRLFVLRYKGEEWKREKNNQPTYTYVSICIDSMKRFE